MESQTVIIQTGGDNQSGVVIPQEVADALQQLQTHGALDSDQPTIINLGELGGAHGLQQMMLQTGQLVGQDGEPYIVVPMMGQEENMQIQQIQQIQNVE